MLKRKLIPLVIRAHPAPGTGQIIFLDRDGVINRFPGIGSYVTRLKDFRLISGAADAIRRLTEAGFEVDVISNQGCVSRGLISLPLLRRLTKVMVDQVDRAGGRLNGIFYCVHQISDGCSCKKPGVVLLKKALGRRKFPLSEVFFIGDSKEDMQAAKNLGCRSLLVLSGRTRKRDLVTFRPKPDVVKNNLTEAVEWILQRRS